MESVFVVIKQTNRQTSRRASRQSDRQTAAYLFHEFAGPGERPGRRRVCLVIAVHKVDVKSFKASVDQTL